ncbi:MAG: hypothetical protein WDM78_05620 [Puia sp.]
MQTNPDLNIFTVKPLSRKVSVEVSEIADSISAIVPAGDVLHMGKTDQDNAHSLLMNNSEWVTGSQESFKGKNPVFNSIYKTQANFLEVNEKDFFLAVNPVLQFSIVKGDRKR